MTRRRTILYCNPFRQEISGADESLLALLEGLDRSRYRPIVVLPGSSPYELRYREIGVDVYHLPILGIRRSMTHLLPYVIGFAPASLGVARLIVREHVDLVHSNMSVVLQGGAGGRLAGLPCLFHARSTSIATPPLACDLLVRAVEMAGDRIVAASESIAQIFRSRRVRRPVDVVHDAIRLDRFAKVPALDGAPGRSLVVGAMGRINPRKGFEHFVAAAALIRQQHPGTRFIVFGGCAYPEEERYLQQLRSQATSLGLGESLEFRGHATDVPGAMQECDVFALCSIDEGFGRVVVEAKAAGRPVVGSAIGGIRELIRDGEDGALTPARDAPAVAAAISRYCQDRDLLVEHGARARESISAMGVEEHARRIEEIYEAMFSARARAAS